MSELKLRPPKEKNPQELPFEAQGKPPQNEDAAAGDSSGGSEDPPLDSEKNAGRKASATTALADRSAGLKTGRYTRQRDQGPAGCRRYQGCRLFGDADLGEEPGTFEGAVAELVVAA